MYKEYKNIYANYEEAKISTQDILFAVESFCYVQNLENTLKNWGKITQKKGRIIIFDVFLPETYEFADKNFQLATQLTGIGFAVKQWWSIKELIKVAENNHWKIIEITDISSAIHKNLKTFANKTRKIFQKPLLAKSLMKIGLLSPIWVKHCMTGVLASHTIGSKAQAYYRIELENNIP
jgi:hypothetical protein